MNKLKNLPIGIQSFEKLRELGSNYVYIDKTEHIYKIIKHNACFLSRPRRFGKSLLCSTIKALFENKRELFKGLWIDSSDWNWQEHPVICLSFSGISHDDDKIFRKSLTTKLQYIAKAKGVVFDVDQDIKLQLTQLVESLHEKTGQRVIILIDEYDKPIIDHITNLKIAEENRVVLSNFFETIKNLDDYTRFVFLTGVSKFSKASVFSGLNNLIDLTNNKDGATLCGLTHQELLINFDEYIEQFAQKENISKDDLTEKLKIWYDGYCFFEDDIEDQNKHVYNPFSILNSLNEQKFKNYWFLTGTPRFLLKLIKKKQLAPTDVETKLFPETNLASFDIEKLPIHTLLLQTGYLSFKSYDKRKETFALGFPNVEIKKSFVQHLAFLLTKNENELNVFMYRFRDALDENDIKTFLFLLQQFFRNIPYNMYIKEEKYFQSLFYVVMVLLGANVDVEHLTNNGRVDAVLKIYDYLYLIEFKYGKDAQEALQQIHERQYFAKYLHLKQEITLIGINFDIGKKEMSSDWIVEPFLKSKINE